MSVLQIVNLDAFHRDVLWATVAAGGAVPNWIGGATLEEVESKLRKLGYEHFDREDITEASDTLDGWIIEGENGYTVPIDAQEALRGRLKNLEPAVGELSPDEDGWGWVLEYRKIGPAALPGDSE